MNATDIIISNDIFLVMWKNVLYINGVQPESHAEITFSIDTGESHRVFFFEKVTRWIVKKATAMLKYICEFIIVDPIILYR